jgi:hypothetical protein
VEGFSSTPARRYAVSVPPKALAEAGRGIARGRRRTANPALAHLLLDESNASLVRLATPNGNGGVSRRAEAEAPVDDSNFPDCSAALPAPSRQGGLYDPARHGTAGFTHVRIGVNARQFADTLKVVSDLAAEDPNNTVVMTVPMEPNRPIRLDARCEARRAAAAVMPVSTDFADYDEPGPARRRIASASAKRHRSTGGEGPHPPPDAATAPARGRPSRRRARSASQIPAGAPASGEGRTAAR